MAATLDEQTLESFRLNNFTTIQANISPFLATYIASRDILSLSDFAKKPVLDFLNYKRKITSDADLVGLHYFAPTCEQLILPSLVIGVISEGNINLSEFKKLKVVSQSGSTAYQAFEGDISALTSLEVLSMTTSASIINNRPLKTPTLSANLNLKTVYYSGTGFASILTTANTGNLQANMQLSDFRLTSLNTTGAPLKAMIDNILSSLRAQKVAGGAIVKIDLTATPKPTGAPATPNDPLTNPDYAWLIANGVTVTLGTL